MPDPEAGWTQLVRELHRTHPRTVLLPLGAVEAHGPHLPLETDSIIATHLAQAVRGLLADRHHLSAVCAPALTATAASWAADFPGTFSLSADAARSVLRDSIDAFVGVGATRFVLVNLHFDPAHLAAVRDVVARFKQKGFHGMVFPDFTRRASAKRIGGEFETGACHGGEFETSLMLAAAPEKVGTAYAKLPTLNIDLAKAIRSGKTSFREVGMNEAYCGHPSTATVEEGLRLFDVLTTVVVEEALQEWAPTGS